MSRSDQRRGAIWAAGWGIGSPDLARAAAAAGRGRRRCKAAAQRRRAAAQRPHDAGVHRLLRVLHQNVEHVRANSTGTSRGGCDDAQRRTKDSGGGGAPAKTTQRHDALQREPTAPRSPLPHGEATELLQCNRTAAETRAKHGSADQDGGEAGT
jgi:hypothetical protein